MSTLAILTVIYLLLPESALACPRHTIALDSLVLKSPGVIFSQMILLLLITTTLGFAAGRIVRCLSWAGRITTLILVTAGFLILGGHRAWACHGVKTVGPILKAIHAAQLKYHERHGVYAATFKELGMKPPSKHYSFFLPSETLVAENPSPLEGVNLGRLPMGIAPVASADKFTVVALAFTKSNRIDVWTMDQDKDFKEWSVPALPRVGIGSQKEAPATTQRALTKMANKLEGPLMVMTLLLGLGIGFRLSARAPLMPRLTGL